MPQLSLETFVTQYFWLLAIFFTVFFLTSLFIMPKIAEIKKSRKLLENVDISNEINIKKKISVSLLNKNKCE